MENIRIAAAQFEHAGCMALYRKARRPELYRDIIGQPHVAEQKVVWMNPKGE
ncbi:MAG TPA: hypothetical protein VL978_08430 [Puia sp.]|nr:hypothetical protein [Puia sp.]